MTPISQPFDKAPRWSLLSLPSPRYACTGAEPRKPSLHLLRPGLPLGDLIPPRTRLSSKHFEGQLQVPSLIKMCVGRCRRAGHRLHACFPPLQEITKTKENLRRGLSRHAAARRPTGDYCKRIQDGVEPGAGHRVRRRDSVTRGPPGSWPWGLLLLGNPKRPGYADREFGHGRTARPTGGSSPA